MHTAAEITALFDEELARLLAEPANAAPDDQERFREARRQSEEMITLAFHDPV
jgi:hypothetical protein